MQVLQVAMLNRVVQLSLALILFLSAASSHAMPAFARQYKQQYGYAPSCHACHKEGGGTPLNYYGQAFKAEGKNKAAFTLIADRDSDKDGIANGVEAAKKSNPGDLRSTPSKPGNWLDLSSLIPKEVQALFPAAEAWKPLDATLTDSDIQRAETMGVKLNADDENTIYIPVANRRPIGTGLIFPVMYKDETFFLLMATDRQLTISQVKPLDSQTLPFELDAELFKGFKGQALQSVADSDGDSVAAAISRAVKRAGTLVYIRLKGA
jgi:hypothetical protein